jgi:hypothetical protein
LQARKLIKHYKVPKTYRIENKLKERRAMTDEMKTREQLGQTDLVIW